MIYSLATLVKRKYEKSAFPLFLVAKTCGYMVKTFFTVGTIPATQYSDNPRTEAHEQWVKP
jgi:hypothetical protein